MTELHRFTLDLDGWKPATVEDGADLALDLFLLGTAFATADGRRVDPETVTVTPDGVAQGGVVRLRGQ